MTGDVASGSRTRFRFLARVGGAGLHADQVLDWEPLVADEILAPVRTPPAKSPDRAAESPDLVAAFETTAKAAALGWQPYPGDPWLVPGSLEAIREE